MILLTAILGRAIRPTDPKRLEPKEKGLPGDRRHFLRQAAAGLGAAAVGTAVASLIPACGIPEWAEATEADVLLALANEAYAEANRLDEAKQPEEAKKIYKTAADMYFELASKYPQYSPQNPNYSAEKMAERAADIYLYKLEDYEKARSAYEFFVKTYPSSKEAPKNLMTLAGLLHSKLNLPWEAIKAYRQVVEDYPAFEQAHLASLAVVFIYQYDLKLIDVALKLYDELIDNYKNSTDQQVLNSVAKALLHLAEIYHQEPGFIDLNKELAAYNRFLAIFPDVVSTPEIVLKVADIKYEIAKAKVGAEREKAMATVAKEYYDFVVKYKTNLFVTKSTLVWAAEKSGDIYSGELKDYQKSAESYKAGVVYYGAPYYYKGEKLWWKMCTAFHLAQDYKTASLVYLQFSELYPQNQNAEGAYYLAIQCLKQEKRINEAIAVCQTFLVKFPNSQWRKKVLNDLAALYKSQFDFNKSLTVYELLLKDYPDSLEAEFALFQVGCLNVYLKNYQKAVEAFEQFVLKYPASIYLSEVLPVLKSLCVVSGVKCQKAY